MPLTVQVLTTPGCEHARQAVELVGEVLGGLSPGVSPETVVVLDPADAERLHFPGSPTVRVNGVDVEPDRPAGVGFG
jgi:hypothetical protein